MPQPAPGGGGEGGWVGVLAPRSSPVLVHREGADSGLSPAGRGPALRLSRDTVPDGSGGTGGGQKGGVMLSRSRGQLHSISVSWICHFCSPSLFLSPIPGE